MTDSEALHSPGTASRVELGGPGDGSTWFDPETAHNRVGDPEYTTFIPKSCAACLAAYVAETEAQAAAIDHDNFP